MITVKYQTTRGGTWYETVCNNAACFANWRSTFNEAVIIYKVYSKGKLVEEKRIEPFYVKLLQWMF